MNWGVVAVPVVAVAGGSVGVAVVSCVGMLSAVVGAVDVAVSGEEDSGKSIEVDRKRPGRAVVQPEEVIRL